MLCHNAGKCPLNCKCRFSRAIVAYFRLNENISSFMKQLLTQMNKDFLQMYSKKIWCAFRSNLFSFCFFFSTKCFFLWYYIFLKCAKGISRRNWKLSLNLDHREKITVLTIILHPKSAIFSYRSKQAGFCCNLRISDNDMIFQKKW